MKTIFKVPVSYEVYGYVNIEANNIDDLNAKLQDDDFVEAMTLPDDPSYIDGSYTIEFDMIDELNDL